MEYDRKLLTDVKRLKNSGLVDDNYIQVRLNAFYAHICHSNSKKLPIKFRTKYNI